MRLLYPILLISLFGITACDRLFESRYDRKMFTHISLIQFGMEYPRSLGSLDNCNKHNDKICLKTFELVKAATQRLKSKSHTEALDLTLRTIEETCINPESDKENVCEGAVVALYFFSEPEDDPKIMSFITNTTEPVAKTIFDVSITWLKFRKDKKIWKEWATNANLPEKLKKDIVYFLNEEKPSGLTLETL